SSLASCRADFRSLTSIAMQCKMAARQARFAMVTLIYACSRPKGLERARSPLSWEKLHDGRRKLEPCSGNTNGGTAINPFVKDGRQCTCRHAISRRKCDRNFRRQCQWQRPILEGFDYRSDANDARIQRRYQWQRDRWQRHARCLRHLIFFRLPQLESLASCNL